MQDCKYNSLPDYWLPDCNILRPDDCRLRRPSNSETIWHSSNRYDGTVPCKDRKKWTQSECDAISDIQSPSDHMVLSGIAVQCADNGYCRYVIFSVRLFTVCFNVFARCHQRLWFNGAGIGSVWELKIVFLQEHFLFTCSDTFAAVRCIIQPQYTSSQTDRWTIVSCH